MSSSELNMLITRLCRSKLQSDLKDLPDLAVVRSSIQETLHLLQVNLFSRPAPPTHRLVYSLGGVHADFKLLACCMACLAVALSLPGRAGNFI